jgi:hypothetical protein
LDSDWGISVHVGCPEGAKKLLVAIFTAEVVTEAFLGVRDASPVECRFRLRTSLKPSA